MATFFRYVRASAVAMFVAAAGFVSAEPALALTPGERADLQKVEDYLNELTTVAARFMQVTPNGSMATGSFYLERPGKMRVEYDPPVEILMVSTGRGMFVWDGSVKQTTQVPVENTPAYLLAEREIAFGENVLVKRLTRGDEVVKALLTRSDDPNAGAIELTFTREPFELTRWSIFDPDGGETKVALLDARFGIDLEERLFLYISPEITDPSQR